MEYNQFSEQLEKRYGLDISDYDQMKEKLVIQVISAIGNEEKLVEIPYMRMEDMAVVFRFQLECTPEETTSILINHKLLSNMGITKEQLVQDAYAIAPIHHPARIRLLVEVMRELTDIKHLFSENGNENVWVASTGEGSWGAGVIAYPGFMEYAAEIVGGSFFLIPSSVHEVLLTEDNNRQLGADVLSDMVVAVNAAEVAPSERLSCIVYHYDAQNHIFETAYSFEKKYKKAP